MKIKCFIRPLALMAVAMLAVGCSSEPPKKSSTNGVPPKEVKSEIKMGDVTIVNTDSGKSVMQMDKKKISPSDKPAPTPPRELRGHSN